MTVHATWWWISWIMVERCWWSRMVIKNAWYGVYMGSIVRSISKFQIVSRVQSLTIVLPDAGMVLGMSECPQYLDRAMHGPSNKATSIQETTWLRSMTKVQWSWSQLLEHSSTLRIVKVWWVKLRLSCFMFSIKSCNRNWHSWSFMVLLWLLRPWGDKESLMSMITVSGSIMTSPYHAEDFCELRLGKLICFYSQCMFARLVQRLWVQFEAAQLGGASSANCTLEIFVPVWCWYWRYWFANSLGFHEISWWMLVVYRVYRALRMVINPSSVAIVGVDHAIIWTP